MWPLLLYLLIGGITAAKHYRLKNDSLCLQVSVPAGSQDIWVLNKTRVIVHNKVPMTNFMNKVDYDPENTSLCINKLTDDDSGEYTISFVHSGNMITHTHTLVVQDAVPKPVLRVSPLLSNQSAEWCNTTELWVNCSVQEDWLMSLCSPESCTTTDTSLHRYNITIVAANQSVTCTGSNQASRSSVSARMDLCGSHVIVSHPQTTQHPALIISGVAAIIVAPVSILLIFSIRERCKGSAGATQPEEPPGPRQGARSPSSGSPEDASAAQTKEPGRGSSSGSSGSSPPSRPEHSPTTDTVYSFLKTPDAATCVDKRAEAPSGPAVSQPEAETGVDTVYCLLQKPQTETRS